MIQIPDHPMIRCMERTGYPPRINPNYLIDDEDDEIESEDDEIESEDS